MKIIFAFLILGIIGFYSGYLWIVSLCAFGCVFAIIHLNDKRRERLQEDEDYRDVE
jgi:ABC-type bacteriocin/lantibiotic exporter with double-glycine peptidase domain|tara:strand:+ start:73 stop:240 length:168 start_codon:yes stop_codon:yes gene_type:complete